MHLLWGRNGDSEAKNHLSPRDGTGTLIPSGPKQVRPMLDVYISPVVVFYVCNLVVLPWCQLIPRNS